MFEKIRRQLFEKDPWMRTTPAEFMAQVSRDVPHMDAEARLRALHVSQWHADYYCSKQNRPLDPALKKQAADLAFHIERANTYDRSRMVLEWFGGPREALQTFISQSQKTGYFHDQTEAPSHAQRNEQGEKLRSHDPAVRETMHAQRNGHEQDQAESISESIHVG